jgi:hypothetical protein
MAGGLSWVVVVVVVVIVVVLFASCAVGSQYWYTLREASGFGEHPIAAAMPG